MNEAAVIPHSAVADFMPLPRRRAKSRAALICAKAESAELDDIAEELSAKSRAQNTNSAYSAQWRLFCEWAGENGGAPFPAAPRTVRRYIAARYKGGAKPATLSAALAAIGKAHCIANLPNPAKAESVMAIVRGAKRNAPEQQQARPLFAADIEKIAAVIGDDLAALRDIAIIRVMHSGLLRESECAAAKIGDLQRAATGARVLRIPKTKTGIPRTAKIDAAADAALNSYLRAAKLNRACPNAPLFCRLHKSGGIIAEHLNALTIGRILARRAASAGIDGITGHSARVGKAKELRAKGFSHLEIGAAGGWKDPQIIARYTAAEDAALRTA